MHTRPRWFGFALLAAGAFVCGGLVREARRRRALTSRAKPEPLQVWENEGGGVPIGGGHTAAQVRPSA